MNFSNRAPVRLFLVLLALSGLGPVMLSTLTPYSEAKLEAADPIGEKPVFPVGRTLRKNVDFWISIYSKYYTYQGVIHDAKYINHVYEVLDFKESRRGSARDIRDSKKRWRETLLSLHRKQKAQGTIRLETLTKDELRVYRMYHDVDEPNKFLNAAHRKRLRFQLGQKDRFIEGIRQSGRYLPVMEEIFRREGLPVELTRLPFVESSFNTKARSKVGASGIWQFMRSTGKIFLDINESVDERNDPIRATEAAAKLLKQNFNSLKSWPLAVTAYNHGRMGMMRAVRQVGSNDLEQVVTNYRSRTFGFASSNFYSEFMAAVEVERNAEKYFGKIQRDVQVPYLEAKLPHYISFQELSKFLALDERKTRELNPALSRSVLIGSQLLPAGYRLRVPYDGKIEEATALKVFRAGYERIPAMFKLSRQVHKKYGRRITSEKRRR